MERFQALLNLGCAFNHPTARTALPGKFMCFVTGSSTSRRTAATHGAFRQHGVVAQAQTTGFSS